jgi:hypothetical protein
MPDLESSSVAGLTGPLGVMVATKPIDLTKGAEGPASLVREAMGADPFFGAIYMLRALLAPAFACLRRGSETASSAKIHGLVTVLSIRRTVADEHFY